MQIRESVLYNSRQSLRGLRGLYRIELLEIAKSLRKISRNFVLFLTGIAWASVSLGFWLADFWEWKYISISLALFLFALIGLSNRGSKKITDRGNSENLLSRQEYLEILDDAGENFSAISGEMKVVVQKAVSPKEIVRFTIKNNPQICVLGALALGLFLGTKEK
jgi:hypothetical protein